MQNTVARRCRNDIGRFWRVLVLTNPQQHSWSPKNKIEVWYDPPAYKIFLSIISQHLSLWALISGGFGWSYVWGGSEIRIQMYWARLLGWARCRTYYHSWVHSHLQDHYEKCFKSYQAISFQGKSLPSHILFRDAL